VCARCTASATGRRSRAKASRVSGDELAGGGLRVDDHLTIPLAEITLRTSRSSGPGGQHANVTASRVEASFDVGASSTLSEAQRDRLLARVGPRAVAVAQDARSQSRNRELALQRLAARIAQALVVPKDRRGTRPTAASRERRLTSKRRDSQRKRERRPPGEGE
jgi:ribosome-associated protein